MYRQLPGTWASGPALGGVQIKNAALFAANTVLIELSKSAVFSDGSRMFPEETTGKKISLVVYSQDPSWSPADIAPALGASEYTMKH